MNIIHKVAAKMTHQQSATKPKLAPKSKPSEQAKPRALDTESEQPDAQSGSATQSGTSTPALARVSTPRPKMKRHQQVSPSNYTTQSKHYRSAMLVLVSNQISTSTMQFENLRKIDFSLRLVFDNTIHALAS